MKRLFLALALAVLAFAVGAPAQAETAGPGCEFGWTYPTAEQARIDGFRLYIDGKAQTNAAAPADRAMPCPALTAGTHTAELTAFNAVAESPKSDALAFSYVTGAPAAPSALILTLTLSVAAP